MSTPWTFDQRIAAYRAEGITGIIIMSGARTHNRDAETGRPFGPVYGLAVHHTAGVSSGMADLIYSGLAGLPGPLAQDFLAKDGTLYVVGHGRANHAGSTTPAVLSAFKADRAPSGERDIGSETVDGNDFLHGLEIENEGDGDDPYPGAQYEVAVRWAVAHLRHYGWTANSAWGHKEITRRKIDPSFSMTSFRQKAAQALALPPGVWGTDQEDEVALTAAEIQAVAEAVWAKKIRNQFRLDANGAAREIPAGIYLEYGDGHYDDLAERINLVGSNLDAVATKVDSIAVGGVDLDALAVKVADEIYRRMQA